MCLLSWSLKGSPVGTEEGPHPDSVFMVCRCAMTVDTHPGTLHCHANLAGIRSANGPGD